MIGRSSRSTRRVLTAAAVLLAALGLALPAGAQADGGVEIVSTDISDFPIIRLGVAVSGAAAEDELDVGNLLVRENDEAVDIDIQPLSAESLEVALAIDISGSMAGEPLAQAKVAAVQFLDELPPEALVAVVAFGDEANLISPATTDRAESRSAISSLSDAGGTALFDGVALAATTVLGSEADRTAVVVLSDGADTTSKGSLDDAKAAVDGVGTFFAVSLETGDADEAALVALSVAAGGRVVPAVEPAALSAAYVDLGQRIVNQYAVEFRSITDAPAATFVVELDGTSFSDDIRVALPNRPSSTTAPVDGDEAAPGSSPLITEGRTGLFEKSWVLYVGAALIVMALLVIGFAVAPGPTPVGPPRPQRRSLASDAADLSKTEAPGERVVATVRETSTRLADRLVKASNATSGIDGALDRAGIVMRAGEFVALVLAAALGASLVFYLLADVGGAVFGFVLPLAIAPLLLSYRVGRRNREFADQLGDAMLMMAGSLRSGFGVAQTIDNVAQEMEAPMGVELQRALLEIRLGREIESALGAVAQRMDNEDFGWVVDAMRIHRQVGGDLAQILDQVAETIRSRNRLRRQVAALTAEGRLSALVLAVLPLGVTAVLYVSNPGYLRPLVDETAGRLMLIASLAMLGAGAVWLRKLIDMEI